RARGREAQGARRKAQGARGETLGARRKAQGARGETLGARRKAQGARGETLGARRKAQGARGETLGARRKPRGARRWAQGARGETLDARRKAQGAGQSLGVGRRPPVCKWRVRCRAGPCALPCPARGRKVRGLACLFSLEPNDGSHVKAASLARTLAAIPTETCRLAHAGRKAPRYIHRACKVIPHRESAESLAPDP